MGLIGSIFGGAIGFTLGGPIGGILGAVVGHKLGDGAGGRIADARQQAQAAFFVTTFSMLAKLAKADGHVSDEEIALVRDFMRNQLRLSPQDQNYAIEIFRKAKESPDSFEDYAHQFASIFAAEPRMREVMLDLLVRLAAADGTVHPNEEKMLRAAARIFQMGESALDGLLAGRGGDPSRHYAVLGISPSASPEEIKKRYRHLVAEYHPDKIIGKGLPQEFVELAETRFKEIQAAYEEIKTQRGIH